SRHDEARCDARPIEPQRVGEDQDQEGAGAGPDAHGESEGQRLAQRPFAFDLAGLGDMGVAAGAIGIIWVMMMVIMMMVVMVIMIMGIMCMPGLGMAMGTEGCPDEIGAHQSDEA